MIDAEIERKAAEDAFARTALRIPTDEKLRAMSYITLCDLLSNYPLGTTQHSILEQEKARRDTIANAKLESEHIQKEKPEPAPDHWYKKPVGVIGITVVSGLLLYFATLLVKQQFGLL